MGIKCFNANFLRLLEDFRVAKKTELNVPSPTLQCIWKSSFRSGVDFFKFAQLSFAKTAYKCISMSKVLVYKYY